MGSTSQKRGVAGHGWARTIAASSVTAGALGVTLLAALHTNWFRYGASLEALYALAPTVVVFAVVALPAGLLAWRRRKLWMATVSILAALSLIPISAGLSHQSLGYSFPNLRLHDIQRTDFATLETTTGRVEYAIELQDVFARGHREFLVLRVSQREHRLEIRLLGAQVGGLGWTGEPRDFVEVAQGPRPGTVTFALSAYAQELSNGGEKSFVVDLERMAVESMDSK